MKALSANRVAALAAFLAGLGGCATALAGVWPSPATTEIALIGGSVATFGAPLAHIVGSWLWDRTPAGQAAALQAHPKDTQADATPVDEESSSADWEPDHALDAQDSADANTAASSPPMPAEEPDSAVSSPDEQPVA